MATPSSVAQLDGHPGPVAAHARLPQPKGHIGGVVVPADRQGTGDGILSRQKLQLHQRGVGGLVDLLHGDDVGLFLQNALDESLELLFVVFLLKGVGVDGQNFHSNHLIHAAPGPL